MKEKLSKVSDLYQYINTRPLRLKCGGCNNGLDWWKVIRNAIKENFMLNGALSAIGANSIAFNLTLVSGVTAAVRFQDYGIPEDAKILYINYTPYTNGGDGGLIPLEVHYNIPYRHSVPNEMKLYPMPLGKGEPGKDSGTSIWKSGTGNRGRGNRGRVLIY